MTYLNKPRKTKTVVTVPDINFISLFNDYFWEQYENKEDINKEDILERVEEIITMIKAPFKTLESGINYRLELYDQDAYIKVINHNFEQEMVDYKQALEESKIKAKKDKMELLKLKLQLAQKELEELENETTIY
jgi:hypothetical protein